MATIEEKYKGLGGFVELFGVFFDFNNLGCMLGITDKKMKSLNKPIIKTVAKEKWFQYDDPKSNEIYYKQYRNTYLSIDDSFIGKILEGQKDTLKVLLVGCGNLYEVLGFIKNAKKNGIKKINFFCLDNLLWPINALNIEDAPNIKDALEEFKEVKVSIWFYKCNLYDELSSKKWFYSTFDIVYFSRVFLPGEPGYSFKLVKSLYESVKSDNNTVAFSQVIPKAVESSFKANRGMAQRLKEINNEIIIVDEYGKVINNINEELVPYDVNGLNFYLIYAKHSIFYAKHSIFDEFEE